MDRRLRLACLLALCAAQTTFLACGLVFPTELASSSPDATSPNRDSGLREAAADAGRDTGSTNAAPADADCGISPPPNTGTLSTLGEDSIIAAIRTVYYAQDAGPIGDLGFDLDCVDTCPGPGSCKSPQQNCDLPGGRDVAGNLFIEGFEALEGESAASSLDARIATGALGSFIWLSGYNGEADDSAVFVATLSSTGTVFESDGGPHTIPKWDGNDVWLVDPNSAQQVTVNDGGPHYLPSVVSTVAYVSNYTLVASLSNVPIDLFGTSVVLTVVTLEAQITPVPGVGYRLDGQLAGRIALSSLFLYLTTLRDPVDNSQYLCGNDKTFMSLLGDFCSSADIMAEPGMDNLNPLLNCNALSASIGFMAFSAKLGDEYPRDPIIFGCDASVAQCP